MRILVLSDSHNNVLALRKIVSRHSDINHIFFLGDVTGDIEKIKQEFSDKNYYIVSGNCDFNCPYPQSDIVTIENTRIYYCHGHKHMVKYTDENIIATARINNCKLALFGHTHKSLCRYEDGIYIVNPGSVSLSREGANSYAVIDITNQGIMPSIMKV